MEKTKSLQYCKSIAYIDVTTVQCQIVKSAASSTSSPSSSTVETLWNLCEVLVLPFSNSTTRPTHGEEKQLHQRGEPSIQGRPDEEALLSRRNDGQHERGEVKRAGTAAVAATELSILGLPHAGLCPTHLLRLRKIQLPTSRQKENTMAHSRHPAAVQTFSMAGSEVSVL